ncbi:outer membrane beta-barrel protein [Epilithonimonas sp.]|uniref:outer membrane beta-barrel protein n=1 Tax=Epilithonimonas sp. TaxID=2894511 RepID=UPI0028A17203|nr:outer membrane beta-barrel protein [Epilithonimonas sp.]
MKKLLLVGALALFGAVNAQKNTILVGGNISYNTSKTTNNTAMFKSEGKADEFSFNPQIGYQVTDRFTVGVKLGVSSSKQTGESTFSGFPGVPASTYNVEIKDNYFQYGVFGRYTVPLNETFAVFGELDVFASNGKSKEPDTTSGSTINYIETKTTGFGLAFTPNLFINFKNSFGLNFNIGGIGYTHEKVKDSEIKTNQFGFGFGKGITVGISKNFGTK